VIHITKTDLFDVPVEVGFTVDDGEIKIYGIHVHRELRINNGVLDILPAQNIEAIKEEIEQARKEPPDDN